MKLENKVALVTGAGRGIGYQVAVEMLNEGAIVHVIDLDCTRWKESSTTMPFKENKDFFLHSVDITDTEKMIAVINTICEHSGTVDILVNNAGINRDALLVKMTEKEWDDVFRVNLRAPFIITREVCKKMIETNTAGSIVNIVSTAAKHGNFGQGNYSAAKSGLLAFTKTVAREMARYGIRVNAVMPGLIDTPMSRELKPDILEKRIKEIPLKRMGTPQEVAKVVIFLASSDASYITGTCIQVDGGLRM